MATGDTICLLFSASPPGWRPNSSRGLQFTGAEQVAGRSWWHFDTVKPTALVEFAGTMVVRPHFQANLTRVAGAGFLANGFNQLPADAQPTMLGMHDQIMNVDARPRVEGGKTG